MRNRLWLTVLAVLCVCAAARAEEVLTGLDVPMRDGVVLKADVYLPDGDGPFPVAMQRTPYSRTRTKGENEPLLERGIAYVSVDVRGRFDSGGGPFVPFIFEAEDGADTLKWVLAQPWCNGRVAGAGGSYVGFTQWALIKEPEPGLVALAPLVTTADMYGLIYRNGAFSLATGLGWGSTMHDPRKVDTAAYLMAMAAMKTLPLTKADNRAGHQLDFYDDWVTHPEPGPFWDAFDMTDHIKDMHTPVLLAAGWFDLFLGPQLRDFMLVQELAPPDVAAQSHLVIGPWDHSFSLLSPMIKIPDEKGVAEEFRTLLAGWYDWRLKGEDNPTAHMPPVRLYVMGLNEWRFYDAWPPPDAQYEKWYFHSDGHAADPASGASLDTTAPVAEPADTYTYDPADPTPSRGGTILSSEMGPYNYAKIEQRPDVLSYTSAPLEKELTLIGPLTVTLYADTDACGADFAGRLLDVAPDGIALPLAEGIVRTQSLPAQQDGPAEYIIDLWATAYRFEPGHRLRVDVASAAFPHWDRNRSLCDSAAGKGKKHKPAQQTIYHDAEHPSHIVLPISKM